MKDKKLIIEKEGEVDYLTLNRPNELNTLDDALMLELRDYFGNLYFDIPTDMAYQKKVGDAYFAFCLKIEANREIPLIVFDIHDHR